jgi:hypothetical protein
MERMSHSKGFKALQVALAYVEQGETSAADATLPQGREAKLGNKLQSLIFLNNNICHSEYEKLYLIHLKSPVQFIYFELIFLSNSSVLSYVSCAVE